MEVTDEHRYHELLDKRKNRRAGESLYTFLERQVKAQMRDALGQPLSDISSTVLNKMVSKEVAMDLKKYKMNAGVKPSAAKRSKSKGDESPTAVRFEDQARQQRSRGRSNDLNKSGIEEAAFHNSVKKLLRDLDNGVAEKITLM